MTRPRRLWVASAQAFVLPPVKLHEYRMTQSPENDNGIPVRALSLELDAWLLARRGSYLR